MCMNVHKPVSVELEKDALLMIPSTFCSVLWSLHTVTDNSSVWMGLMKTNVKLSRLHTVLQYLSQYLIMSQCLLS